MSIEAAKTEKRVVETFVEAVRDGDLDALDDVMDADLVYSQPTGEVHGLAEFKEETHALLSPFADVEIEVHEMVAEDDLVVVHFTFRGIHEGELQGIQPTGNTVELSEVIIARVEDGKIVDGNEIYDGLSFFQQLGVDPPEF